MTPAKEVIRYLALVFAHWSLVIGHFRSFYLRGRIQPVSRWIKIPELLAGASGSQLRDVYRLSFGFPVIAAKTSRICSKPLRSRKWEYRP